MRKPVIDLAMNSHLGSVVVAADISHEGAARPDCNHVNVASGKSINLKSIIKYFNFLTAVNEKIKPVLIVRAPIPKPPFLLQNIVNSWHKQSKAPL